MDVYAELTLPDPGDRPHVYLGMVSSVDGAAVVGGRSGGLGGAADRAAFRRLRETCDTILVGAGTVRAEDYGPPPASETIVARRQARGLGPRPTIAVVTASGDLDADARLFSDPTYRPLVVTTETAAVDHLADVADVLRCGHGRVDLDGALRALGERGGRWVLCEGGPTLNAQLVAGGLADELFLTLAPTLVGGAGLRILDGPVGAPAPVELTSVQAVGDELLLRYHIGRPTGPDSPAGA